MKLFRFVHALCVLVLPVLTTQSIAQGVDVEPNNSCAAAQYIGAPSLPYTVDGSLEVSDIDFFRFQAAPASLLQINLQGQFAGLGTLTDPLLGIFDESCNPITINDDYFGPDSLVILPVPLSGELVAAATSFPDYALLGSDNSGSYRLTFSAVETADSVRGRVISGRDGSPITGDFPTYAAAYLYRCTGDFGCDFVSISFIDSNGEFYFDSSYGGLPLLTGNYRLEITAQGYESVVVELFDLLSGEARHVGDVVMQPYRLIGSVSGRVIDASSGAPLTGFAPPFTFATLERCEAGNCYGVAYASPDFEGRFRFEGVQFFVSPGTFRVVVSADDYRSTTTSEFDVTEFADVDIGDIQLTPFPIQFGNVESCNLSTSGGLCEFGISLQNRGPGRFRGEAWATVTYFPNASPYRNATFQVGRLGTKNPMPERINLRAGQSSPLMFQLQIPAGLPEYSSLCVTANVGSGPDPQFTNQGDRFLFCGSVFAGNFDVLPQKEGRRKYRELKQNTK